MDEAATLHTVVSISAIFKNWVIPGLVLLFGLLFLAQVRGTRAVRLPGILTLLAGRRQLRGIHRVVDGDSIEVIAANGRIERVRLIGIDAPEYRTQPYGQEARAALSAVLETREAFGRRPTLTIRRCGRDQYGRTLARVWRGSLCVNSWMIANGHAWAERGSLAGNLSMAQARLSRRGLWADRAPVSPSLWRRAGA